MDKNIDYYINCFKRLYVDTKYGKAPHKAILLMTIIDMVERGDIDTPRIYFNNSLIETYDSLWTMYAAHIDRYVSNICPPFLHMESEPFFKLYLKDDSCRKQKFWKKTKSVDVVKEMVDYAEIDLELFELLKCEKCRSKLRVVLISTYLAGHSFCGDDRTILKRELESFQKDFSDARDEDLGMRKDSEIARTNKVRRYSLDDETFFCKRRFALEVVRQLVRHYPNRSFEFYESLVPERVESGSILVSENVWLTKSEDGKSRFFCAEGEGFVDCHGLRFFVSNQWTGEMIEDLIVPVVKALGYTIYRKY